MKKLLENFRRFINEGEVIHVDFNRKKIVDPYKEMMKELTWWFGEMIWNYGSDELVLGDGAEERVEAETKRTVEAFLELIKYNEIDDALRQLGYQPDDSERWAALEVTVNKYFRHSTGL